MKTSEYILDHLQFENPTKEQKQALLNLAFFVKKKNKDDFYILSGAAGTGKTSMTTALIGHLNNKGIFYQIAAPTGRAARILGRKSNTLNHTIHSLIYDCKPDPNTGVVNCLLKENSVKDLAVYVIDEASMISSVTVQEKDDLFRSTNSLLSDLIFYVKSGNQNNKIVFLGDDSQLPPLYENDSKALSVEYLTKKYKLSGSKSILTEVKRQADGTTILQNACRLRIGIEGMKRHVPLFDFEKLSVDQSVKEYLKSHKMHGHENAVSIGCTHKMNQLFNNKVRVELYGSQPAILKQGDLLIVTRTWRRNGHQLYNGDHIVVQEINMTALETVAHLHFARVKLKSLNIDGDTEIIDDYILLESILNPQGLTLKQENALRHERYTKNKVYGESGNAADDKYIGAIRATYGHSITCNKAQGGEWNKVFLNSYYMPTLKYQYTAITRAKEHLILY